MHKSNAMTYYHEGNTREPAKGKILISEPFLPDPNFTRTVVLICEHNEEGTFGLVLNKPSLLHLKDVMENISRKDHLLYIGGPVQQDTLHYIHRRGDIDGAIAIAPGIFWGGNFEKMLLLLESGQADPKDFQFFLGYSGWGKTQLLDELAQNSWIVSDIVTPRQIFETAADSLWKQVLSEMGGKFKMFSNYPLDPRSN